MAYRKDKLEPPEELLDKVRNIPVYRIGLSLRLGKALGETSQLRSYLGDQLDSLLSELSLEVSCRESGGIFGNKNRLSYQVVEKKQIRLEFIDIVRGSGAGASRSLQSVRKYEPGDWEQKVDLVYQKCLELRNDWNQVLSLEKQLHTTEDAERIVKLIEATRDVEYTIKILALSANYDANTTILHMAYLLTGRVRQACKVLETAVQLNQADAQLHLALGNFYWAALCNAKGWAPGLDVGPLKQITLETLGCSYEIARNIAETQFLDAIKLSTNRKLGEQANSQLVTLRMMNEERE